MCVFMHRKAVRLGEQLIEEKPIHPHLRPRSIRDGRPGGLPVSLVSIAVLFLIQMQSHYYIFTYLYLSVR